MELALATLKDADLELLQELSSLHESGFDEKQITEMMGERYQKAQEAIAHFNDRYQELLKALRQREGVHGL